MDLHDLKDTPSWQWPEGARDLLLATLRDAKASENDRRLAVEMAGDPVVVDDDLAAALIDILENESQAEDVRARAAISLGPVLEQVETEEDTEDLPITRATFDRIQASLRRIHTTAGAPKDLRRRVLEASVRAPQSWHRRAIGTAFASDDETWKLTAVFCMRFVKGFDEQILESLDSNNPDIHYHAVIAAGNWELKGAWSHIRSLLEPPSTNKDLLLAAIEAVPMIRPGDAPEILDELLDSHDDEIVDAVEEALAMARGLSDDDDDDDDDDDGDERG